LFKTDFSSRHRRTPVLAHQLASARPFSLRGRQVLIVRDSQHGRVIGKTVVTVVP